MPKSRVCPFLSNAEKQTMCLGESCAIFEGEDDKHWGMCAVSDIAGWLKNIAELAAGAPQPATEETADEKAGAVDPQPEEG